MNALGQILTAADVALDADVSTSDRLLEFAAGLVARRHGFSASDVGRDLAARERLGSTALGHAMALPHARIVGLPRAVAAFIRTRHPIAFSAADAKSVSNFLVLLVPAQAADEHLKLIAEAAGLFNDPSFRAKLRDAVDPDEVVRLFAWWAPG